MRLFLAPLGVAAVLSGTGAQAAAPALTAQSIEAASFHPLPAKPGGRPEPSLIKAAVLLARARVSPGSIDGHDGDNLKGALAAFQKQAGLPVTRGLDQPTWDRLVADKAPVTARYTLTAADLKGPYVAKIPSKFESQGKLKRLAYRNVREMLGERFHMSPTLLVGLNPGKRFRAGETIDVVNPVGPPPPAKASSVVVDKEARQVEAFGPDGAVLAVFPASIGSEEKPAPSGRFEIRRVVHRPDYTYLPRYRFKGVTAKQPFTIAPGPNNPVGIVWIDLSFEGYGIHGTPEPELIGKTQSHGCIRLANWDAEALAALVDKGTPVTFQNGADNPVPPPSPAPTPSPAPSAAPSAPPPAPAPSVPPA